MQALKSLAFLAVGALFGFMLTYNLQRASTEQLRVSEMQQAAELQVCQYQQQTIERARQADRSGGADVAIHMLESLLR